MVKIIFESHATSIDNERDLSSGHNDIELSELGLQQARELGARYENEVLDGIFCSDLQRSYKTAEIAFGGKDILIIKDKRLRECDYGDLTQHPADEVKQQRAERIKTPFPNGESYEQTSTRMKDFLKDLLARYDGKTVMIIGHRATQYGLEHWIQGINLYKAVTAPWQWQPGWLYELKELK